MNRIEVRLSDKAIKNGYFASIFMIVLSAICLVFLRNEILIVVIALALLLVGLYAILNLKKSKETIAYILDDIGLHINIGKGKYATIYWSNIEIEGHSLFRMNGVLHVSFNLKDVESYTRQLSGLSKFTAKRFYGRLSGSEASFPIENYNISPEMFLETIGQGISSC